MSRSTRLFEIIDRLRRAKGPITAEQIAEELEVTVRTVYRDMAALQAMRLPIYGEAGVGYVMRAGYDLPPLMFTTEEIEAICVGLSLLSRTGDLGLTKASEKAAAKIAEVLPKERGESAPLLVSGWNALPSAAIGAETMRSFIRESRMLEITYLDLQDRRSERRIKPLALIYYIDVILVAAWCDLRQDFRQFRLDRIEALQETGERFTAESAHLQKRWEAQISADQQELIRKVEI